MFSSTSIINSFSLYRLEPKGRYVRTLRDQAHLIKHFFGTLLCLWDSKHHVTKFFLFDLRWLRSLRFLHMEALEEPHHVEVVSFDMRSQRSLQLSEEYCSDGIDLFDSYNVYASIEQASSAQHKHRLLSQSS